MLLASIENLERKVQEMGEESSGEVSGQTNKPLARVICPAELLNQKL